MHLFKRLLFFGCSVVISLVRAQPGVDSLTLKFDRYRTHALQEKLYAHIDRSSYLTGELLWFKIYCVDGVSHERLDISKVAYVEVIDKNNVAVVQSKVELRDGLGSGSLFIPALLNSDNYLVRIYTQWMKNFSPEFYFHQLITIVNPFTKVQQTISEVPRPDYDVQFFPEGGYAVVGVKSKIGFRAIDQSGKGIQFTGALINSKNDTVAHFQPLRFGIGHFYFTPETDETYRAIIFDTKGNQSKHSFPKVEKTGYAMSVTDSGNYITIDVKSNGADQSNVYFFAHTRLKIIKSERKLLSENAARFTIRKNELGEGITQLTIFNQELNPVCERLYFKRPEQKLEINIRSSQERYTTRALVKLNIQSNFSSDVSISVYQRDSIPSHDRQHIFEYLWLTSDLKGTVEEPHYYMLNTDSIGTLALDNLMLTHGWRRFRWNDVLNTNAAIKYIPEYRGHIIHGKIVDGNGLPVSGVLTTFSSPDEIIQLYGSRSNDLGELRFEVKDYFNERIAFIHPFPNNGYQVKIENPFSTEYASVTIPSFQLLPSQANSILNRSLAMQVQNVYSFDQINQFKKTNTDSLQFYGRADKVYFLDNYVRFPMLEEVLREYVSGVLVRKRNDGFYFRLIDNLNNNVMMQSDPLVLLDGVPVMDNNKLLELSALKIKKIEVVAREYNRGPLVFSGILSFFSYQSDLVGDEIDTKNLSVNYEGLQAYREFYSPLYETTQAKESRLPDKRTLLYWNASQAIEASGNTTIRFYSSDLIGEYEVVVEGLTKDGVAGSSKHSFSIAGQK
jgi:hypothetical protein